MTQTEEAIQRVLRRAEEEPDGFHCEREGTAHRVDLWGRLPEHWAGNLALHAAAGGIQLIAGDAVRLSRGQWGASFLVEAADPKVSLQHDFLTMSRRQPRGTPTLEAPTISIGLRVSETDPGDVYARVVGKNSVGLVAQVLERFDRYDLRPKRFVVRTRGDEVEDWFWLETREPLGSRVLPLEILESDWDESTRPSTSLYRPSRALPPT